MKWELFLLCFVVCFFKKESIQTESTHIQYEPECEQGDPGLQGPEGEEGDPGESGSVDRLTIGKI